MAIIPSWCFPLVVDVRNLAATTTQTARIKVGDTVRYYYGQERKYTVDGIEGAEAVLKYFTERDEIKLARAPLRDLVVHVEEPKPVKVRR